MPSFLFVPDKLACFLLPLFGLIFRTMQKRWGVGWEKNNKILHVNKCKSYNFFNDKGHTRVITSY